MRKLALFLSFILFVGIETLSAQTKDISGKVVDDNGAVIPGVSVLVKGTTVGTITRPDGMYNLTVPENATTIVFSFIGMKSQEVAINGQSTINVTMTSDSEDIDEVVVTALGISKDKKSLGYSVQEVGGDEVAKTNSESFISSMSGKVSGLNIKQAGQAGGSVNVVIRGSSSITGNNQALFVVDGVPINNDNTNTDDEQELSGGYDYGNAASDIDPSSIESISVLKGATAAALYGSAAANGVVLITTKKGSKRKGLGVSVKETFSVSSYDKKTFPEYQTKYGAGYGAYYGDDESSYFNDEDFNGDGNSDLVTPFTEDASYGAAFDGSTDVVQWYNIYPELEDTYQGTGKWEAGKHGPASIFKLGYGNTVNVAIDGGNDKGTFRLGYTNDDRTGILENNRIKKNILDFNSTYNVNDKLSFSGKLSYSRIDGRGRYGTGYSKAGGNVMNSLRQWYQMNVDMQQQRDAYYATKENITWNTNSSTDLTPIYWDNPYWVLNENYETDQRNRIFGKFQGSYKIDKHLTALYRFGMDVYSDLREERIAIGSLDTSEYSKYVATTEEYNHDAIINFDYDLTKAVNLSGLVGMNIKRYHLQSTLAETNGGLVNDRVYSLSNSASTLEAPEEKDNEIVKYGWYAQASFGMWNKWYVEGTARVDKSSTLPSDNNTYFYPSVSTSFVFNDYLKDAMPWLNFGKVRVGYAEVGNDAEAHKTTNYYKLQTPFGSTPMVSLNQNSANEDIYNNPHLKNETIKETEAGLELKALHNRLGLDFSYYTRSAINQILDVEVSWATGYNYKTVNAGKMTNKGVELALSGTPVKTGNFQWDINVNWAKNKNKVVSLYDDVDNIVLYSQWTSAVNATAGQAYGTITGYDFQYKDGKRIVGSDGKYLKGSDSDAVIGNIQPDWTGGMNNTFSYKNLSLGFLIDVQKGGDVFSWDMDYAGYTGLYKESAATNKKGHNVRDAVADGGGVLLDGVVNTGTDENPIYSKNTTYADASDCYSALGYYGGSDSSSAADKQFVYDASYVKLREVTLSYNLPKSLLSKFSVQDLTVSAYGRNLWIIYKNLPYADPEYTSSSGNNQGIQNSTYPTCKEVGFSLNLKF